jgi:hypothetical protein
MSLQVANDLVIKFNNGDYLDDIEPYFNDLITFFRYLKKYDLLDEIELGNIPSRDFDEELWEFVVENDLISNSDYNYLPEELKNYFLLYELENNYEWVMEYITNNLITDVDKRQDGFYLYLKDKEDLSNLFCGSNRDGGARYVAKMVLSEDGLGHEWYFDYNRKPFDTIDELDETNFTALKDIIFKEIGNKELSLEDYNSDFFESLSEEQGTEGYFRITAEDITELLKDQDAINELCKNDLDELGSNLISVYHWAENGAYEDEVYDYVFGGLEEYFEGRITDVPREVTKTDGSKVTRYDQYIKIRDFQSIIKTFLENTKGQVYNDSHLEYYGDFIELLVGMINNDEVECINFRVPEYPDWSRTTKNINEMFNDYI